ncbi:peptidoglycan D,D-transpeptidase FtsI family protein [Mesobacillus selenatarsenatis]|uniref:serine-type D-Ala-D-Ala carboxypeptidase n=1 Tax=Mesobacillus selenatarsenatis (strain DSM 18680 / JCM 14380 / FERM P-15431 / SF-1) TaxID=1321606 RepID=A0A0A8X867_MESS1|nr:penicillin-binding transpeptidase domain-containing protein [Mesobacillus selenatarsenatis]GAM16123.1 cell division protein FtsI [peptidoglycan synthetase] [Mesobacillus selenatarsenatis SF-1]
MRKKRMVAWISICIAAFGLLMLRLAQLQLYDTESFSKHEINLIEASVKQRSQEMVVDNGRGNFLDRKGAPLSYETSSVLVLFPFLKKMDWEADKIARTIGVSVYALENAVEKSKEPFAYGDPDPMILTKRQMDIINEMEIPGVFAVERKYPLAKVPAAQLLGIIGENESLLKSRYVEKDLLPRTLIGLSGLEKSFDEFLVAEGKSKLVYHVDGAGAPLFGINVKYIDPANPFYPINLQTSIDKDLQMILEEKVDEHNINRGGVVLLDIETNSILAMVSRPDINTVNPYNDEGTENMMVKQHIPGSVFKTVVAAAAIDHGLDDPARKFDCSKTISGDPDLKYDHGILNFADSFAVSCNRTFGEVARELQEKDPNMLEKYAEMLSITGGAGWKGDIFHLEDFEQLQDEEKGRVFLSDEARKDRNFAALSGIGQHEVRVSPLAVANMMATIARGGEKNMVRAVFSIQYQNGAKMTDFPKEELEGAEISPFTAMKLQKLLREVVLNEEGTGRWFRELPYSVAGKSGTAETGIYKDDKQLHNKWFAGYFPYEKPKYALVTVNLGVLENEGGVNPLFADIVKEVYAYNHGSLDEGPKNH